MLKELLDTLARRRARKEDLVVLGVRPPLAIGNLEVRVVLVNFVPDNDHRNVRARVRLQQLNPLGYVCEGVGVVHGKHDDRTSRLLEVKRNDGTIYFLAGRVPEVELVLLALRLERDRADARADRRRRRRIKRASRDARNY